MRIIPKGFYKTFNSNPKILRSKSCTYHAVNIFDYHIAIVNNTQKPLSQRNSSLILLANDMIHNSQTTYKGKEKSYAEVSSLLKEFLNMNFQEIDKNSLPAFTKLNYLEAILDLIRLLGNKNFISNEIRKDLITHFFKVNDSLIGLSISKNSEYYNLHQFTELVLELLITNISITKSKNSPHKDRAFQNVQDLLKALKSKSLETISEGRKNPNLTKRLNEVIRLSNSLKIPTPTSPELLISAIKRNLSIVQSPETSQRELEESLSYLEKFFTILQINQDLSAGHEETISRLQSQLSQL